MIIEPKLETLQFSRRAMQHKIRGPEYEAVWKQMQGILATKLKEIKDGVDDLMEKEQPYLNGIGAIIYTDEVVKNVSGDYGYEFYIVVEAGSIRDNIRVAFELIEAEDYEELGAGYVNGVNVRFSAISKNGIQIAEYIPYSHTKTVWTTDVTELNQRVQAIDNLNMPYTLLEDGAFTFINYDQG